MVVIVGELLCGFAVGDAVNVGLTVEYFDGEFVCGLIVGDTLNVGFPEGVVVLEELGSKVGIGFSIEIGLAEVGFTLKTLVTTGVGDFDGKSDGSDGAFEGLIEGSNDGCISIGSNRVKVSATLTGPNPKAVPTVITTGPDPAAGMTIEASPVVWSIPDDAGLPPLFAPVTATRLFPPPALQDVP